MSPTRRGGSGGSATTRAAPSSSSGLHEPGGAPVVRRPRGAGAEALALVRQLDAVGDHAGVRRRPPTVEARRRGRRGAGTVTAKSARVRRRAPRQAAPFSSVAAHARSSQMTRAQACLDVARRLGRGERGRERELALGLREVPLVDEGAQAFSRMGRLTASRRLISPDRNMRSPSTSVFLVSSFVVIGPLSSSARPRARRR